MHLVFCSSLLTFLSLVRLTKPLLLLLVHLVKTRLPANPTQAKPHPPSQLPMYTTSTPNVCTFNATGTTAACDCCTHSYHHRGLWPHQKHHQYGSAKWQLLYIQIRPSSSCQPVATLPPAVLAGTETAGQGKTRHRQREAQLPHQHHGKSATRMVFLPAPGTPVMHLAGVHIL